MALMERGAVQQVTDKVVHKAAIRSLPPVQELEPPLE